MNLQHMELALVLVVRTTSQNPFGSSCSPLSAALPSPNLSLSTALSSHAGQDSIDNCVRVSVMGWPTLGRSQDSQHRDAASFKAS